MAEGMKLDTTTNEGKLLSVIIDVLEDVALEIADIKENALDIGEELDALSDDLGDVEEYVYEDEEDDEDGPCGRCGHHPHHPHHPPFFDFEDEEDEDDDKDDFDSDLDDEDEEEEDEEEEEFYCAECPNCGGKVYFDDTVNPEDVICPACHKPLINDDEDDLEDEDEDEDDLES